MTDTPRLVERNGTIYQMQTEHIGQRIDTVDTIDPFDKYLPEPEPILIPKTYTAAEEARQSKPTFNRTNDNVDWAMWTWNPVTGCKHGCPYCYARDIANRFTGHFNPAFHEDRLKAPQNTNPITTSPNGDKVFVCSMADLFGAWVPREWIDSVMSQVRAAPQWTFIFLSKNPERMATVDWPENAWAGTTVDVQARTKRATSAFQIVTAPVRFLSIEPFRERLTFDDLSIFNLLLIGGQSATSGEPARQPGWEWVQHLLAQANRDGLNSVWWKPNLNTPKQYPL
jgi:protein gp37